MRLKKSDLPAPEKKAAPRENVPGEVSNRVKAIVDRVAEQIEKLPGRPINPAAYEFEVIRDQRGLIKKIIARPMPPKSQH